MKIWALSGFLGQPSDWNILPPKNLIAVDWQTFPLNSLPEWGKGFNHWIAQQNQDANILMGYSLGGRLALHALIDQPQLWHAAIIVSAHAGLQDSKERLSRQQRDQDWAKRFESENWDALMQAWNSQEIFTTDAFSFDRQESNYERKKLVDALTQGSLGGQEDLRPHIFSFNFPILWITGSQDPRYCQIAQSLAFSHPHSYWRSVEGAGHRVPWSQPHVFSETISTFLNLIKREEKAKMIEEE